MARPRKKHLQQELTYWGGKRKGAGRPCAGFRASERHKERPELVKGQPHHVTLRVEKAIRTLRTHQMYRACRKALCTVLGRHSFSIVEISLQDDHVHLLVEADSRGELSRGMQAFQIAAARYINQAMTKLTGRKRRGRVFCDRYHDRALASPLAVRHARAYVLNNWRKHQRDRGFESMFWEIDPFSSAASFAGWKEAPDEVPRVEDAELEPLPVSRAQTWLLSVGWMKHGLISTREVPGKKSERLVA